MDELEIREMKAALYSLLDESGLPGGVARVEWLCNHLNEYLARWAHPVRTGFLRGKRITDHKLFIIILVTIDAIDSESFGLNQMVLDDWQEWTNFKNAVMQIQRTDSMDDVTAIERSLKAFQIRFARLCS